MDYVTTFNKLQAGLMVPSFYSRKVASMLQLRITDDSFSNINTPEGSEVFDFDLKNNWLIASHAKLFVSIYCARTASFKYISTWKSDTTTGNYRIRKFPFECVNWNSMNQFFTVSGNGPSVHLVDTVSCSTLETIEITGASKIYQHKPMPHQNASIAVASNLKTLPIIDIRTGTVASSIKGHSSRVKSIAWSAEIEYLLASSSERELCLWDIRMTNKPKTVKMEDVSLTCDCDPRRRAALIVPEIQFYPGENKLVGLTYDRKIFVFDIFTGDMKFYEMTRAQPNVRYKFSLVGMCERPLMFMPSGTAIKMIDLNSMEVIKELSGHLFPVRTTIFNTIKNELYSAGKDGSIIWTPQRM